MARRWDAKMGSYFCAGPNVTFVIRDGFPAAHRIRIDTLGTLEPVHVHHWRVKACLQADGAPEAVSVRARDVIATWVRRHRGRSLNDIPPFERVNPTAEEVARQLCEVLGAQLPELRVRYVEIGEAAGFSATYWPPNDQTAPAAASC